MVDVLVYIYRSSLNNNDDRLSNRFNYLTLLDDEGIQMYKTHPSEDYARSKLKYGLKIVSDPHNIVQTHLEPIEAAPNGHFYLSGGSFAFSHDERFPFDHPVPIWDMIKPKNEETEALTWIHPKEFSERNEK